MDETDSILNEIRIYLRISAAQVMKPIATTTLDSYEKALVFSKLDGKLSQTQIESETKMPIQTIGRWLNSFVSGGIVVSPTEFNPGYKALFTLQELGINLSELKKRPSRKIGGE
jgi:hypothetical protein